MSGRKIAYRKRWTPEEDIRLRELTDEFGTRGNWNIVGKLLGDRSAKQCRERWNNIVNPHIKKRKWTPEEDATIFAMHAIHGTKWVVIASALEGRGDNDVKNRFYSTLRRHNRQGIEDDDNTGVLLQLNEAASDVEVDEAMRRQGREQLGPFMAMQGSAQSASVRDEVCMQPPTKRKRAAADSTVIQEDRSLDTVDGAAIPIPRYNLNTSHSDGPSRDSTSMPTYANLAVTIPAAANTGFLHFRRPGIIRATSSHHRATVQVQQAPPPYSGFSYGPPSGPQHFPVGSHGYYVSSHAMAGASPVVPGQSRSLSPQPARPSRAQLVYEKTFSDGTIIRTPLRSRKSGSFATATAAGTSGGPGLGLGPVCDAAHLEDLDLARSLDELISDSMLSDSFAYMWSPGGAAAVLDVSITPMKFTQSLDVVPEPLPSHRLSSASHPLSDDATVYDVDVAQTPASCTNPVAIGSVSKPSMASGLNSPRLDLNAPCRPSATVHGGSHQFSMSPQGCEDGIAGELSFCDDNLTKRHLPQLGSLLARKPHVFSMETCVAVGYVSPRNFELEATPSLSSQPVRGSPVVKSLFTTKQSTPSHDEPATDVSTVITRSPLGNNLLCALPVLTAAAKPALNSASGGLATVSV